MSFTTWPVARPAPTGGISIGSTPRGPATWRPRVPNARPRPRCCWSRRWRPPGRPGRAGHGRRPIRPNPSRTTAVAKGRPSWPSSGWPTECPSRWSARRSSSAPGIAWYTTFFGGVARTGIHLCPTLGRHYHSLVHGRDFSPICWSWRRAGENGWPPCDADLQGLAQGIYFVAGEATCATRNSGRLISQALGRRRVATLFRGLAHGLGGHGGRRGGRPRFSPSVNHEHGQILGRSRPVRGPARPARPSRNWVLPLRLPCPSGSGRPWTGIANGEWSEGSWQLAALVGSFFGWGGWTKLIRTVIATGFPRLGAASDGTGGGLGARGGRNGKFRQAFSRGISHNPQCVFS